MIQQHKLGELCEIKKGNSITRDKINEGNVPVIAGGQQPAYYHNESNRTGETITISASGAYAGFVNYFNIPIFASDCSTIQSKQNNIFMKYVYYFLKSNQSRIYKMQKGIAQPHVYPKDLAQVRIPLPPLPAQKAIVKILEQAEKLKQKREEADKLTQEYLKSVFYEMFLKDKKFNLKKGKELFELVYGKGLSDKERDGGKYQVYGSNGVVGGHSEFLIKGPGIIIGRKGSIGEVNYSKENFWPIDTTYYIRALKEMNFIYLYYLLKSYNLKLNSSTAIPGLNRNEVYSIDFIDAPLNLQQKFAKIMEKVEKMKDNQKKSKEKIDELFNSLMQKAFRGELVR
jgi:restriction endonuclease S subunit